MQLACIGRLKGLWSALQQNLAEILCIHTMPICQPLRRIAEGASVLEAEDWDTGEALSIPLDATKSPVEQAEALYK